MLKNIFKVKKFFQIYSPVNGKCVDLKDVNDQLFADKIMGEGVAFKYNGNNILRVKVKLLQWQVRSTH